MSKAACVVAACHALNLDEFEAVGVDVLGLDPCAISSGDLGVVPFCQGPEVEDREIESKIMKHVAMRHGLLESESEKTVSWEIFIVYQSRR